eukprot:4549016-Pleurochrysis_carterae.AAC.1
MASFACPVHSRKVVRFKKCQQGFLKQLKPATFMTNAVQLAKQLIDLQYLCWGRAMHRSQCEVLACRCQRSSRFGRLRLIAACDELCFVFPCSR